MAMDKTRMATRALELTGINIAALGASPSLNEIALAMEEARAQAYIEEQENYLTVSITGIQVDPQTGTQTNEVQANVAT